MSTYSDFTKLQAFAAYDHKTFLPNLDLKDLVDTRYTLKLLILAINSPKVKELAFKVLAEVCNGENAYGIGKIKSFDGKRNQQITNDQGLTNDQKKCVEASTRAFAKAILKFETNSASKVIFDNHKKLRVEFKNEILAVEQAIYDEDATQSKETVLKRSLKEAESAIESLKVDDLTADYVRYKFEYMLDNLKLAQQK